MGNNMKKIKLDIVGLSYSQTQSGAYALVLGEISGRRRLPIIIGSFEAQAIAIEIEKMTPSRPLTHDLFKSFADAYHIEVQEIIIYNLVDGIFYAKLICSDGKRSVEAGYGRFLARSGGEAAKPTGRLMPDIDPERNFGANLL